MHRFWSKIDIKNDNECWDYKGGKQHFGYGQFWFEGKTIGAHKFSYQLHHGSIPKDMCVCHSCDNPTCVNPKHLWLGTKGENNKDRSNKKRSADRKGELCPTVKLKEYQAIAIKYSNKKNFLLAKQYNISQQTVCDIKKGKRWRHI